MADFLNYGSALDQYAFGIDYAEAAKLQSVQPGSADKTWWENLLQVGMTKAIDSHFQSQELDRILQVKQVGIQGANGYTYAPGVQPQLLNQGLFGMSLGTVLLLGIGAFVLVKIAD